jgi:predicted adenine nucleotide alpha hydrolase (AANH) superfamily ATPase
VHDEVTGLFYNPNIHPFQEFCRRVDAVKLLGGAVDFPVAIDEEYGLNEYMRRVVFHEHERCPICYEMRLVRTVQEAVAGGFEGFTTTLLYSKYQNHRLLIARCEQLAAGHGLQFVYEDFRQGWQEGIDASIAMGLYRQPYCGCLYSEQERYDKRLKKRMKAAARIN